VSRFYLDTSAAAKLLAADADSEALADWADGSGVALVATHLLETELRRFGVRHGVPQAAVTDVLDRVSLYDLSPGQYHEAGVLPGADLRSLDGLHIVGAIHLGVAALVTYDTRLAHAAASLGVTVHAPSSTS
jgi:predicted nucleic acid-binding protein